MDIQIGTDEAGYGPNLGPLTISGTRWKVRNPQADLYNELSGIVAATPRSGRITIADSKVVYQSGQSIAALESCVLAALFAIHDDIPSDWTELIGTVCDEDTLAQLSFEPWMSSRELKLPLAADTGKCRQMGERLRESMRATGVELQHVCCVPVFPDRFNAEIEQLGNKATLLSQTTLKLVRDLLDQPTEFNSATVVCDKHGGRSKYAAMIQHLLTDSLVRVGTESLEVSRYRWAESNGSDVSIEFVARGESFLPTALALMVSKYVREVFMELWNEFWVSHIPGLKPTKGYPLDARRFKREISAKQELLGIPDALIWRNR